jgi:E3 ubiquitin-protein ligase MYCBP2
MTEPDAMTFGGHRPPSLEPKYEVTVKDKMLYHAITVQKVYENYSFEELRYASPALQRQSENMLVRPNNDGTYSANWTPGNTGFYQLHIVVDGCDMPEPYKVEVKEPPQGVAPPHTGSSKKTPGDHGINRLRKFIAKPSAGLRIRIHPTLQSEQIGVVPVEGTISIMDELQNADGIWVRLCQDSLIEYSTPAYTEGWCLQYNQHLEKTLLIPVAEPKPAPRTSASVASAAERPMMPAPFAAANNPIIEPMLRSSSDIGKPDRNAKKPKGPGNYTVVKCGASGHNVRSNPNLSAAPIGMLALGDAVTVIRTKEVNGEVWVQLDQETGEKHCFSADEGDSWSLAYSNTDILYLENASDVEEHLLSPRGRSMSRPVAVIPPPSQMVNLKKIHEQQPHNEDQHQPLLPPQRPIPPPRHSIGGIQQLQQPPASPRRESLMDGGAASNRARTPSPGDARKPSFFQKWFKGEAIRRGGSQSPPVPRKSTVTSGVAAAAAAMVNKDIPPELMGVSVKELVKVIGESRANGNGVTPPGTPGTPRRASRSASPQLSSRGSSPSSVRLTSGSVMTTAQRAPSKSPLSHEGAVNLVRQDSSQSDNSTSNLVSSLTRDLSQSPHDGSASPSLSMRSEPLRSAESPMRTSSSVIDSPAAKSLTSMQTSSTSGGGLETTAQSTSSITTSTTTAIPVVVPESATSNPSPSLRRKNAKGRSASPSASASTSRPSSSSKQNVTRVRIEAASRAGPMIVKEAMSPSVAESIRSVFAAFVWHEGIVHDAMAVASYLKFHPNMSKHGASSTEAAEEVITEHTRARQRHSVEVSSASAYLNANNIETIDTSSLNANTNRNVAAATSSAKGGAEAIPEDATLQLADSGLPPTIRLLVLIWEEIRSYCIHAILQQVIVASPLHLSSSAASATTSKKSDHHQNSTISNKKDKDHRCSSKPRKSKRSRDEHQLYVDAKEAESVASAASTAASVAGKVLEEAFCQLCEMCGHYFQHPVTYHMRVAHPGCGGHAGSKGYNSGGHYCGGWAGNCGDGGVGGSSWYLICEKCREEHMKRAAPVAAAAAGAQQPLPPPPLLRSASTASEVMDATAKNKANQLLMHQKQQRKKSLTSQLPLARMASPSTAASSSSQINSHIIMNNNAMFLLDLASASNSNLVPPPATSSFSSRKVMMTSSIGGLSAVSELESLDPNPFPLVPFQCFNTLGVRDSHLRLINDELVLDEVLKTSGDIPKEPAAPEAAAEDNEITPPEQFQNSFYEQMGKKPTFSRSASVGNHVLQNQQQLYSGHNVEDGGASSSSFSRKRNSSCEPQNTAGDFLSNPSAALQKLFSVERGSMMVADILQRPVMSFVLQWNDLESLQIAMTNALRKASCRTFAMQALNWLLRSVSQPACLHDLLWCFVSALEGNTAEATATNLNEGDKSAKDKKNHLRSKQMLPNAAGKEGLFDHPTEDISIAGEAIQPLPATFHGLLQTVSDLMLLLPVGSSLQQIAITCWCIKFRPQDHNFLHQSHVFSTISKILSRYNITDDFCGGGLEYFLLKPKLLTSFQI